jgi:hypothetical protein
VVSAGGRLRGASAACPTVRRTAGRFPSITRGHMHAQCRTARTCSTTCALPCWRLCFPLPAPSAQVVGAVKAQRNFRLVAQDQVLPPWTRTLTVGRAAWKRQQQGGASVHHSPRGCGAWLCTPLADGGFPLVWSTHAVLCQRQTAAWPIRVCLHTSSHQLHAGVLPQVMGHTFSGPFNPEFSPKVRLSAAGVAFPPLRPGQSGHQTVAVVNFGDTPVGGRASAVQGRGVHLCSWTAVAL